MSNSSSCGSVVEPGAARASEPLEHVVERALGDELFGELVAPRPNLALHDSVGAEAVLADPVEAWRVDVHRHGRMPALVGDAMDVAGPALTRLPRGEDSRLRLRPVHHQVFANGSACDREPDARDVVVVKPGSLVRHPRQHPRVHPVVLVDELVAPVLHVAMDEWLPDVRAAGYLTGNRLELVGAQQPVMWHEPVQRGERRNEEWFGAERHLTIVARREDCAQRSLLSNRRRSASRRAARTSPVCGNRSRFRISQTPIVHTSARMPLSAHTSARLNAIEGSSPPIRSGFGTAMSFHAAESALPRMPAARTPAAGATGNDGICAIRNMPVSRQTDRTSHASERW